MNDSSPIILPGLPKVQGNPDVINLLKQALAAAEAGKVAGCCIIMAHGPEQPSLSTAGSFPGTLIAGCLQAVHLLRDGMFTPRSPIVKARMG